MKHTAHYTYSTNKQKKYSAFDTPGTVKYEAYKKYTDEAAISLALHTTLEFSTQNL